MSESQTIESSEAAAEVKPPKVDLKLAYRVAEALTHAEHCMDQAFIATTELTMLLPSLRGQTNLAFGAGQSVVEAGTSTIVTLTRARADLSETHRQLAGLRDKLRVPTAIGPFEDKLGG